MTANLLTLNSSKTEFFLSDLNINFLKCTTLLLLQLTLLATLALFLMNTLPSPAKSLHFVNSATIIIRELRCIRPWLEFKTASTIASSILLHSTSVVHCKQLDYCNSLFITIFQTINLTGCNRSRTLLLLLLLRLLNPHISLPFSNFSTGLRSTNALNINFLLPTKFLQPVNLAILTIWSLFNPLAVPDPHLLSLLLAHLPSPHWKSQIAHSNMRHPVSGINSAQSFRQPRQSCLDISSFTCQLISIIITTFIIHHYFALSLQAQNLPFQQILPTLDFFYLLDCLHDNGTGPDLSRSSFYF